MAELAADLEQTGNDGEQRLVTLMFADIAGSTALVQHLEPEEAADLINPLVQAMTAAVERYRGTVSPRGDGVLAIFGLPGSAEDNAVRACLAALDILAAVPGTDGAPRVRIGIHHGEVALLPVGSQRKTNRPVGYDAFGAAVHVAARLEQTADPGSICLSAEMAALVKDFASTRPLPGIELKGFAGRKVERAQLLAVRATSRWHARMARGLTPFVGRQDELALVSEWVAARYRGARLLQVQGPAGIGKSRLVHEALRAEPETRSYLIKLSGAIHRGFTGHDPLAAWLLGVVRGPLSQADGTSHGDAIEALQRIAGFSAEAAEAVARYLGLMPSSDKSVAELRIKGQLLLAPRIAALIAALAAGRRIILSCEDGEALDAPTLELLTSVVADLSRSAVPVLLLISTRRRLSLSAKVFAARRTVRLRPLPGDAARQLLLRINPSFREARLAERVLAKAEGNPLYLEEVAALLLTRPAADNEPDEPIIPNQIGALIVDRLAQIPYQLQLLLQSCSVLGMEFSPDLLTAMVDGDSSLISQQLARLQAENLLDARRDPVTGAERLAFRHALLRDMTYKTLLPSRRRRFHARVAELLEPLVATDPHRLDEICHHAVKARLWRPALGYLQRAAIAAAERTAYAAAEQHLQRALEITQSLPPDYATRSAAVDIVLGLRMLLAMDLRYEEAGRLLDQAQKIANDQAAGALGPEVRLSIQVRRVHVLNSLGRMREATVVAKEAHRTATALGNPSSQIWAAHFLGQTCFYVGRYHQGETALSEGVSLLPGSTVASSMRFGSLPVLVHATRAGVRGFLGKFAEAEADIQRARALAAEENRPYDIAFTHLSAGMVQLQRRRIPQAEAVFRLGLQAAEGHGLKALLPSLKAGVGHSLLLAGSTNAAIDALGDAYETAKGHGRVLIHMWSSIGLAAAYGAAGGLVPALRHAEEAVQLGARHTLRGYLVAALRSKGVLLAMNADTRAEGIATIRRALALARKLRTEPDIAACLLALHVASGSGHPDAAQEARARFAALGMSAWADIALSADPPAVAAF